MAIIQKYNAMENNTPVAKKTVTIFTAAFFVAVFLIVCRTFQDYGLTWDEDYHRNYGELIFRWYLSLFKDAGAIHHPFLIYYGGFFDALAELASYISPFGVFETRHLLGALLGLWTVFMCFKIARNISGDLAGSFAAVFLVFHPVFYGHMFNNPVDIPFTACFLTTLYCLLLSYDDLPRLSPKNLFKLGLSLGLMLGIRIGGLLIMLPCIAVFWTLWLGSRRSQDQGISAPRISQTLKCFLRNLAWIVAIAWPVMLIGWPWAQLNPVIRPFAGAIKAAQWDFNTKMSVFFEGLYQKAPQLPASYLFKSILVTLPEFFLIVLLIGGILAVFHMARKPVLTQKKAKLGLLVFAVVFPLAGSVLFKTPQFDGFRHFLFLIPLLATLGGISLSALINSKTAEWIKQLVILAIVFSLTVTALDMVRLHPYETVYFNRMFAGGLANAAKKYETDYWGNSYREGINWVIKHYRPAMERKVRVKNAAEPFQIDYYLQKTPEGRDRFEVVQTHPDIYLATTRWENYRMYPGRTLYKVERDGTPLLYVIEVKKE